MIKISIIIPVYNKELYLKRCFDNILSQIKTHEDAYEIVVVDDGSTDSSSSIIKSYAERSKSIRLITQKNSGVSVARNTGIKTAKGEFVVFLDADDEIVNDTLQIVLSYLNSKPETDILEIRKLYASSNGDVLEPEPSLLENVSYTGVEAFSAKYVRTNAGGGICRTAFLRENNILFPPGIRNAEDTIFFALAQVYAKHIRYINLPFYRIYLSDDGASRASETLLAQRHADAINALIGIRKSLNVSHLQKAIIEFALYQLISNSFYHFVLSNELGYKDAIKMIKFKDAIPIETKHLSMFRGKAILLNLSRRMFYLLSSLRHSLQ